MTIRGRVVRRTVVAGIAAAIVAAPVASAQRPQPAAVVAHPIQRASTAQTDSTRPLMSGIKHDAVVGAVSGAVIGLLGVTLYQLTYDGNSCCDGPTARGLTLVQGTGIVLGGAAAGTVIGTVLGYAHYRQNESDRPRAQRVR